MREFDVDSEIYELTISMYKQKVQDRYSGIIGLAIDTTHCELKKEKPDFCSLNMLILFMQIVDEESFRTRFMEIILEYSEIISANQKSISNTDIILSMLLNGSDESMLLCEKYENHINSELLRLFLFLESPMVRNAIADSSVVTEKEIAIFQQRYRNYVSSYRLSFYTKVFLRNYDAFVAIDRLVRNDKLRNDLISYGFSRKDRNKILKIKSLYISLSEEQRKIIIGFLC
jgi:hypothetical protein